MKQSFRELSAEALQRWWAALFTSTNIFQERARLKRLLEEDGWTPTQLLNGMLALREETDYALISRWGKEVEHWTDEDVLLSEAQLVQRLMARGELQQEGLPPAWYYYIDNVGGSGAPSALVEQKLSRSKRELEEWLNVKLGNAAVQVGAESLERKSPGRRRVQTNRPERLDR